MELNKIHYIDAISGMKRLPDKFIDTIITSPPYWNLRDYSLAPINWPSVEFSLFGILITIPEWKGQLGLEPTPEMFIGHMVYIFREAYRVLKDTGTLWLNIGDSYARNGGNDTNYGYIHQQGYRLRNNKVPAGLKQKDLIGIPWMLAFALRDDGWYLRQDIIWHKPNPMPESVTDRFTKSHEYIFLLSKNNKYFFDKEAIKEPASNNTHARKARAINGHKSNPDSKKNGIRPPKAQNIPTGMIKSNESFNAALKDMVSFRNKRSVWTVKPEPLSDAHFATFPQLLISDCIKAGSSEHGCCSICGQPYERILKPSERYEKFLGKSYTNHNKTLDSVNNLQEQLRGNSQRSLMYREEGLKSSEYITVGWEKSCDCESKIMPAIILDMFMGSGTTGIVARKLNRNFIGFELNPKYITIADNRLLKELGLFR